MSERKIDPKFNIHETYKKMIFFNPYRDTEEIDRGIFAYFPFDNNYNDVVGGHNGTGTGTTNLTETNSLIGKAAYIPITSSANNKNYITVPNSPDFSFGNGLVDRPFSTSFWVRLTEKKDMWFISKRLNSSDLEYQITYYDGRLRIQLFSRGTSIARGEEITMNLPLGVWFNIQSTYDGIGQPKIHLNGIKLQTVKLNSGNYIAMNHCNRPLEIGNAEWRFDFGLNGLMDELYFFNQENSVAAVLDIYYKGLNGQTLL